MVGLLGIRWDSLFLFSVQYFGSALGPVPRIRNMHFTTMQKRTGPDTNPGSGSSLCHHTGHKNLHFFIPVSRIQSVPQGRHLFRVLAKINVKCFFASVLALFANTYLPNQCGCVSGLSNLLCAFCDNYSS